MVRGIAFILYPVRDIARGRRFCEQDLGLTAARTFQDAWIKYEIGGTTFEITPMAEGVAPSANSGGIVGLATPELERDIRDFFTSRKIDLGGKTLEQYLEQLNSAVIFRGNNADKLHRSLAD